jgi:TolB protein
VRFDLGRRETIGEPVPVLDGFAGDTNSGAALFAVSSTGTLAYIPGALRGQRAPIEWMTHDGQTSVLRAAASDWENPQFSPDGQKLALDISDGRQRDIFVYEWTGDRLTQLTFDPSNERAPVWSPDGKRISFASDRASAGIGNLYSIKADGTGGLERLTDSAADQRPGSWDPSGRFLAFEETSRTGSARVMILPMTGDATTGWEPGTPTVFVDLGTTARQRLLTPSFSPDGRWIAYTGSDGVYVRPFPGPGGQWKVAAVSLASGAGGLRSPQWSEAAHALLLVTGSQVLAAPYTAVGDEFRAGTAVLWSPTSYQLFGLKSVPYAVHPDGKRLAILPRRPEENPLTHDAVFVFNFFDELRRVAAKQ